MNTLEELLQILGCKRPFTKSGRFTQRGYNTYNKLISILHISFNLCGYEDNELITFYKLQSELDKIEWEREEV